MEDLHTLKALLQFQLASDAYAVLHLPYVLETLAPNYFLPSSHTQKWTTRINSLLNSKDPGARWSGLCLALQTAVFSKTLMMECAQSWIGIALPILSKKEPNPTVKAAIRLLRHIFSTALDVPEFQRQLCTQNVPKFSAQLISMAEKQDDLEIKLLALETLAHLVPLYSTLHRASQNSLNVLALRYLNGAAPRFTPGPLLEAASRLYSALHVMGGKVGASNLWQKSVDDTLGCAWSAFGSIRTTFPPTGANALAPQPGPSREDPMITVPLNGDRLRAATHVLCDLLSATTSRPVSLPVGALVRFVLALLRCTPDEKTDAHTDSSVRALEVSVIPTIWALACELLDSLAKSAGIHLTSHLPQLISHIVYHLEQKLTPSQRLHFLRATWSLFANCYALHDIVLSSRVVRAILPALTVILETKSQMQSVAEQNTRSKGKGKKRARGYEGDEVFKVTREIVCPSAEEGQVLLAALDAMKLILRNAQVSPAVHSLASRMLLSIYIALPQMSPALLSPDVSLHGTLYAKVRNICADLAIGTTSTMSKSLGIVISAMEDGDGEAHDADVQRTIDLLLHPRVPPLVRALPHVETLSLFRTEEGEEEMDVRRRLGLGTEVDVYPPASSEVAEVAAPLPSIPAMDRDLDIAAESTQLRLAQSASSTAVTRADQSSSAVATRPSVVTQTNPMVPEQQVLQPPPKVSAQDLLSANISPPSRSLDGTPAPALPSTSATGISTIPAASMVVPGYALMSQEEDEEEPMPTIDMDSDSD